MPSMITERTLVTDLDQRISKSPRYNANSVKEYFRHSNLDWWRPIAPEYANQEILITKWLKGKHFEKGLELGPGFGRITGIIAPKVEDLILVEINKRAVKRLARSFPSANILNEALEDFKGWKENYGLVVAVEVFVHIPNLSDLLEKIAGCLDKRGLFIASITSDDFYKNKHTIIHRGINAEEFTGAINKFNLSRVDEVRKGDNITYFTKRLK